MGRLQRRLALRVYCLSIANPALKAARPPLREGAETKSREEEGRMWTPRDNQAESSLSEQRVGRRGGGALRNTSQPTTPWSLSTRGSTGETCTHSCPSEPSDPLKGRWPKITPPPSLSLDPLWSSSHASLFLVILLLNWAREQEEFRETPKEPETHPHKALQLRVSF